ncbi:MAG TPA: GDSL-type esterase/lipase family protein [Candidatus Dormibacteraeota bacterium]|nr:GDSL-type esterase/lipase family protein [Candidatus Dormibacteraeota bacterium]
MKRATMILLVFILVYAIFEIIRVKMLISRANKLVVQSKPYEQSQAKPRYRVLIIGDSTGVGTGVSSPEKSLAGLLGAEFPEAEIINRSINGLRSDQLAESLESLPESKFNLVIIHIGGNDLIRFKSLRKVQSNIKLVLDYASNRSDKVALFTTGDLSKTSFFPLAARPWYGNSSSRLRSSMKKLATEYDNVAYIDLFSYPDLSEINGYAVDGLHLNDAGYGLWYKALKDTIKKPLF